MHDKKTETFYRSTILGQTENPWIEVSLNNVALVGIVKIVNRLVCSHVECRTRLDNTKVEALGTTGTLKRACGIVVGVEGEELDSEEEDETYYVSCRGAAAMKIRLTDVDNIPNEMNVAEVQVFAVVEDVEPVGRKLLQLNTKQI